ncbi:MAG: M23 family metallopeptidase [Chloroflexi bacterium]|nr:M23 family metallopeptidase [Chloroflexota bacterium]
MKRTLLWIMIALWLLPALALAQEPAGETLDPTTPVPVFTPTPTLTPIPRPLPTSTVAGDRATVELFFTTINQGGTGLLHITGVGLAGCSTRFIVQVVDCFPVANDGFYALISTNMEQNPRKYPLDIFTWYDDTRRQTVNTQVEVTGAGFIKQNVNLAPDKTYLIDPEVERTEFARLESIFGTVTPEMLWAGQGFQLPILGSELTSPFGAFRTFNESFQTRHTGWDIKATLGQPIMASGTGKVAFAGFLDIRGNIVIINHGYGVYSTYSHLSQVHVTRGQSVRAGQIIGTVGSTGRTSGAHFHWEIVVNGFFVDSVEFINLWLPGMGS